TPEFPAFGAVIDPDVLPDILRSDHAAFLAAGYPALMATDTANFRNENYHQPSDTPETLDPEYLASSTRAALAGLATFASVDQDQDGRADVCGQQVVATTTTTAPATTAPTVAPTTPPAGPPAATGADLIPGSASYTG
ncbi:MAG TPA: M28 family peptidase, partial [Aquihabitans sp.]|nr:M28 family peptidase [Aquihabitans sp.]